MADADFMAAQWRAIAGRQENIWPAGWWMLPAVPLAIIGWAWLGWTVLGLR